MKKICLALASSAVLFSVAYAGGPDTAPAFRPSIYAEGNVGYGFAKRNGNYGIQIGAVDFTNHNGGLTWGGDLGFNWTPNFGLEAGYWKPINANMRSDSGYNLNNFQSNVVYAAMKYRWPVLHNLEAFAKLGPAVYLVKANPSGGSTVANMNTLQFLAAAGAQYHFYHYFVANLTYTFVNGTGDGVTGAQPPLNILSGGLGVEFAV